MIYYLYLNKVKLHLPKNIKAYDLENGDEISGFKRLTSLDNN